MKLWLKEKNIIKAILNKRGLSFFILFLIIIVTLPGCAYIDKGLSNVKNPNKREFYVSEPIWHSKEKKFYFIKSEVPYVLGLKPKRTRNPFFPKIYTPFLWEHKECLKAKCYLIEGVIENRKIVYSNIAYWINNDDRLPNKQVLIRKLAKNKISYWTNDDLILLNAHKPEKYRYKRLWKTRSRESFSVDMKRRVKITREGHIAINYKICVYDEEEKEIFKMDIPEYGGPQQAMVFSPDFKWMLAYYSNSLYLISIGEEQKYAVYESEGIKYRERTAKNKIKKERRED